eukprot:6211876-Pleurochrysis_carterae.AAC.7
MELNLKGPLRASCDGAQIARARCRCYRQHTANVLLADVAFVRCTVLLACDHSTYDMSASSH